MLSPINIKKEKLGVCLMDDGQQMAVCSKEWREAVCWLRARGHLAHCFIPVTGMKIWKRENLQEIWKKNPCQPNVLDRQDWILADSEWDIYLLGCRSLQGRHTCYSLWGCVCGYISCAHLLSPYSLVRMISLTPLLHFHLHHSINPQIYSAPSVCPV